RPNHPYCHTVGYTYVGGRRSPLPASSRFKWPIFHWGRPLDKALKVGWIGLHFFLRSSCLSRESPRSPIWAGSRVSVVRYHKNLLQSQLSLCRMVARALE